MMTFGSLFAGIGGFDLGLERAGMECKWQVEKDPFCLKVLAKHWPDVKRYEDIRDVRSPEAVEVICGGFPCQPFSLAGKRRGAADDRYLWPEMLRIIEQVRPSWVIGENVPGIIGVELDKVLSDLEGAGYEVLPPFVIPAVSVDAPHRRDRVWIVAHACDRKRRQKQRLRIANEQEQQGVELRGQDVADTEDGGNVRWNGQLGTVKEKYNHRRGEENGSWQWWETEPDVGGTLDGLSAWLDRNKRLISFLTPWAGDWEGDTPRVAYGVPGRVDRLRALGNAVVPQIPEIIGRYILEMEVAWTK